MHLGEGLVSLLLLHQQGSLGVWLSMLYSGHPDLALCLGCPTVANYTL